jgi:hypothetical protein
MAPTVTKRLRALLGSAVAVLFAISLALPRAGLLHHEHHGGERPHVHADGDARHAAAHAHHGHAHLHHDTRHHHHHHHDEDALARDDGSRRGHWHEQERFQRGVAPSLLVVESVSPAETVAERAPRLAARIADADLRARGPPLTPL